MTTFNDNLHTIMENLTDFGNLKIEIQPVTIK